MKDIFKQFDDNGDGVLVLDEFEALLKSLDPSLKKKQVLNMFRETLDANDRNDDALDADAFV